VGNIVDSLPQGIVWKEDISKWDKEVPLSPKDLLQALDEITTLTLFILGIEKGVPFFAEARKTKRWTSYWGISWLNLERSTITTIPPKKSKSIEIMAIFNGKKERITRHPPKNPRQKVTQQTPQKGGLVIQVGATNLSKGKSAQVGELSHLAGSVKKVNSAQVGDFTKFAQVEIKKFAQDGNLDFLPQDGDKNEKLAQVGNFAISPRKFAQDGNFKNLPKNSAPAPVRVTTLLKGQQPKSVSSVVVRQLNRTGDVGSNPPEVTISDEPRTGSTIDNYTVSQDLGRGFKSQKVKNFDPDWDIGDSEDSDEEEILKPEEQYRDKIGLPETNTQNFWWRQGITPTLPEEEAGIWRKKLVLSTKREETDLLKIVRLGLAKTTRAAHRRALKWMEGLPEPPPKMSIATWLLKSFSERQEERKWQGSTLTSYMASTQGALAHLQIYRNNLLPVILKSSSEWRMGLKGAGNIMRSSIPKQAAVLTHETLAIALKLEPSLKIRTALEVAWVTAGRGGGCNKTPQSGRGVRPERNPSPLRGGEDGHQRTLHGGNGETVTGGSQIRGGPEGGTRSDPMALSPGARGTPEVGPTQGEPPVGTKVHSQRGPPVPLRAGAGGREAAGVLPAPQRADPPALPGLRVAVGGGGGEVVGGSGVKYWRGRTPQYFVKHWIPLHGRISSYRSPALPTSKEGLPL